MFRECTNSSFIIYFITIKYLIYINIIIYKGRRLAVINRLALFLKLLTVTALKVSGF
jgi:hypothetical protein